MSISNSNEFRQNIILNDKTTVPGALYHETMISLMAATQESINALISIISKCDDPNYQFIKDPIDDPELILKNHKLIKKDGTIDEIKKRIILNATKGKFSPFIDSLEN